MERREALASSGRSWVAAVAGPIFSLLHAKPVLGACPGGQTRARASNDILTGRMGESGWSRFALPLALDRCRRRAAGDPGAAPELDRVCGAMLGGVFAFVSLSKTWE